MRRKTVSAIVLSLLSILTLTLGIQTVAFGQKTEIVIGCAESQTGVNAAGCSMHHLYYTMIVEDYNAKGGLYVPELDKRLPIRLLRYDDESNEEKCLTLIEKLITQDNVDLLFAPWSTEFNVAAFSLYEAHQMPVVALTVGSDVASARMKSGEIKYCFVTLGQPYEDGVQVTEMLQYINSNIATDATRIHSIGIIYRADQHGIEHSAALSQNLTAAGFQVPVDQAYPVDTYDFTPMINTLRDANVDVVIACGYGEVFLFIKQCEAQDYNPKLMFHGPVLETPLLVYGPFGFTPGEMAGMAYYDGFPATAYNTPATKAWSDMHYTRVGYLPFPAALPSFYTGLDCLMKAVELVGLDREAIRDALETVTWNDTVIGKFKFRTGQSPQVDVAGTITQWHGRDMMDVVWPLSAASAQIIYPHFPWSWGSMPDVNRDGTIDILDIFKGAQAFASTKGQVRYTVAADLNADDVVNILDIFQVAKYFGQKAFP